ncbi:MAG: mechanosensitive ion channel family protein, partial [Candidatus Zixiibacteriota bacterium]
LLTIAALQIARYISRRIVRVLKSSLSDEETKKRTTTLGAVVRYLLSTTILVVALIMILSEIGIDIGPILATAGVAGLALGFGAQHIIKDLIAGFFMLLDDEVRVGDTVRISGVSGIVEKINLRVTVLRDVSGNVHYIPNGSIEIVTNMTKEYSRYVFEIGIAYRENVDDVIKLIKEVDKDLRQDDKFANDILEPLEVLGLERFADSAVILRARYMTMPSRQWDIGREFNRRLKSVFDAKGIEMPYPHMTVYMGEPKQGSPPPLHINLSKEGIN